MKRHLPLFILALALSGSIIAQTAFQLPNPGFEQWDGGDESEPTHWNTFSTSDGPYASLASSNHHYRLDGRRPGGTGNYVLTIYTKSIIGIKANGNMTTGRVHAGAMSATSSDNYNYTQRSNSSHSQPFTATPDSLYVWVSFYASSASATAQVSAIIHGDNDFKAPNDESQPSLYKAIANALTTRTTAQANFVWKQLKVPFVYSGNSEARYILVNMTTNQVPGQGDANDALTVDDIQFIYSAWLKDLKFRGTTLYDFYKTWQNYVLHVDDITSLTADDISFTTEADDATARVELLQLDGDTAAEFSITVTAEDGITVKRYSIFATTSDYVGATIAKPRSIKMYPNPATTTLYVETEGDIEIVDICGHTVRRVTCHGATPVDISDLRQGIYFEKNSKKKIVKCTH